MHRNIIYIIALTLISICWFAQFSPRKPAAKPKPTTYSSIVTDPTAIGFTSILEPTGGACNLEFINGHALGNVAYTVGQTSALKIKGWALDAGHSRLPDAVAIRFAGNKGKQYFSLAQTRFQRDDVMSYLSLKDDLLASGFELHLKELAIPLDQYRLSLLLKFCNNIYLCDNGRVIRVE